MNIKFFRFDLSSVEELTKMILKLWTDTVDFSYTKEYWNPERASDHNLWEQRVTKRILERACDEVHQDYINVYRGGSRYTDEPLTVGDPYYFNRPHSFSRAKAVAIRYAESAWNHVRTPQVFHLCTDTYGCIEDSNYPNEAEVLIRGLYKIVDIQVDEQGIEHIYLDRGIDYKIWRRR